MRERISVDGEDFTAYRIEQARLLKQRIVSSCLIVEFVICNATGFLLAEGAYEKAAIWFASATFMVLVTFAYARLFAREGVTETNVWGFLRGYIAVSCATGLVWSAFAIYQLNANSPFSVLISVAIVVGITLGGILPSSAYRPAYVGLAICTLAPFSLYLMAAMPLPFPFVGLGLLAFLAFGLFTSARADINTRDAIAAKRLQDLMAQVMEQNETIQRVQAEKTRFLSATSHDLAQPLHAQGYFIQSLRDKLSDPDQLDLLGKIENNWRGQIQILRGLVEINRLDAGAIIAAPLDVDLAAEMKNTLNEFEALSAYKGVTLKHHFDAALAYTDPVLFNRIVRNLISNAIKFNRAGGTVELRIVDKGEGIQVDVFDDGPGIPVEKQELIFHEYVRLKDQGGDGLGLGLSIVRRLADLLGLGLQLQSSPGAGTVFSITLPKSGVTGLPNEDLPDGSRFASTPLVVIVDDEKSVRDSMTDLLSIWGCQVISARSAVDAVSLLGETENDPTLLIIDRQLAHGEDGRDVIRLLREEANGDTPAILMTGDIKSGEESVEALPPSTELLYKPVEPHEIRSRIVRTMSSNLAVSPQQ